MQNTSLFAETVEPAQKQNTSHKFDQGFEKKINDMINSGETRSYNVIILVKKAPEKLDAKSDVKKSGIKLGNVPDYLDAKSVAKQNKDRLESELKNVYGVKQLYKAQVLSFITAKVPLDVIHKLAEYDYVVGMGDGELELEPQSLSMDDGKFNINSLNLPFNGSGIKVSVIDTGMRQDHPDLPIGPQKIIDQVECTSNMCNTQGNFGDESIFGNHGTHQAGIIAGLGQNDTTMKGVAAGALLLNAKSISLGNMAEALDWSLTKGAKVANISLAAKALQCGSTTSLDTVVDEAIDEGMIVVAAAGNFGPQAGSVASPACGFNSITVGAIDDMDTVTKADDVIWNEHPVGSGGSSRGPVTFDGRLKPELVTPGVRINSTDLCFSTTGNNYNLLNHYRNESGVFACQSTPNSPPTGNITGTSHAAPFVSGAAAIILQAHPEYSPLEVKAALLIGANYTWHPNAAKRNPVPMNATYYENNPFQFNETLNAAGFGLLDVNKTLTFANSGKNIIKDFIDQDQIKKYSFSAKQGEQVKVILSWLKHPGGNVTDPTELQVSNLDFNVTRPDGTLAASSTSMKQNNEFVVFNATVTGSYKITVSAPLVLDPVYQTFALASTHALSKGSFFVKQGTFAKTLGPSPFARPDADNVVGGWTVTPLWQKLDEVTPDNSDFVSSPTGTSPEFEVRLSDVTDPVSSTGHIIKFRAKASVGSGAPEKANAILFQGTNQIAQTGLQTLSRTSFTQFEYSLSATEANAITDYDNLSIKIQTSKANTEIIQVSWIEFQVPPPTTSQTVTGVGFQPKALMLFTTGQSGEGSTGGYNFAIGFSDGTNSRSIGVASDDEVSSSNAGRAFGTKIIKILGSGSKTVAAEADLTGFNSDGFTLSWTTNDSTPSIIHYIALGGDDLTKAAVSSFEANTVAGNQTVTGLAFKPDFLMFMHAGSTSETSTDDHGYLSYGFTTSLLKRGAIAVTSEDGRVTTDTCEYQRTDKAIVALKEDRCNDIDAEADIVSMNANGFTINWNDPPVSADRVYFLALKGGIYDVGSISKITSVAPAIQKVTDIGFLPRGVMLSSFNNLASTEVQSNNRLSLGATDGTNQGTIWAGDADNLSDSKTARSTTTTKVIRLATEVTVPPPPCCPQSKVVSLSASITMSDSVSATSGGSLTITSSTTPVTQEITEAAGTSSTGSIDAEANIVSLDPDGFTINWTTNDALAKQILYVAFGMPDGPINLSENQGSSTEQRIAATGSNVYVTWSDNSYRNNYEVFFRASTNNGATFGPIINISNSTDDSFPPFPFPVMAASGSNVYLTWTEKVGANNIKQLFSRSTNNGTTFDPPITLSNTASSSSPFPGIAASGNNVHVAWTHSSGKVQISTSTNNGASFGQTIDLNNDNFPPNQQLWVAASGDNVYVSWTRINTFFTRSTNNGANFTSPISLSTNAAETSEGILDVSGNNVYAIWQENHTETIFRKSTNNGASFDLEINISNTTTQSIVPYMVASGNNVYVTWNERPLDPFQVFFRKSTDNGASFASSINVSNNTSLNTVGWNNVDAVGSNVYLIMDQDTLPTTFQEQLYRKSTDNGATFGSPVNLSNNTGNSNQGRMTAEGKNVYVTWRDRDLNEDIYFVRTR